MKIARVFPLIAASLLVLACQVEENIVTEPEIPDGMKTVVFSAGNPDTKTVFTEAQDGKYPVVWTKGDAIFLSMNEETPASLVADLEGEDRSSIAYFTGTFEDDLDEYTFYAISPSSAVEAFNTTREAWVLTIPAIQTPVDGSTDESAQILAATTGTYASLPENLSLHFSQVTAYMRMTLNNLETAFSTAGWSDASIESIDLKFSTGVAGTWYCGMKDQAFEAKDASSSITLMTDSSSDLWFALAPVDISEQTLKISVNTDQGTVSRTITFESLSENSGLALSRGGVFTITVNMAKATEEEPTEVYELVLDLNDVEEGDNVAIVNSAKTYAMPTSLSSSAVSVTVTDDRFSPGSSVAIFEVEIERVAEDNYYYFKGSNGYLTPGSSSISLSSTKSLTSNGWNGYISYEDGSWNLWMTDASDNDYLLVYNSNSKKFTSYSSGSSSNIQYVLLFKRITCSSDNSADILSESTYGAYYSDGTSLVYSKATDDISREYDGTSTVSFAILKPSVAVFMEMSGIPQDAGKGDNFNLTVTEYSGMNKVTKEYYVAVSKEEGSKLWLTSKGGDCFIVKK